MPENKQEEKSVKKYTPADFQKAIDEISKTMGYRLNISPIFFQQDNGTFSLKITSQIIPFN